MRCQDKVRCGVTILITTLFFLSALILMMHEASDSTEENSNDTESVTMDTGNTRQNSSMYNTLPGGEEVLNILDMVQNTNNLIPNTMDLNDTIDIRSYTDISLRGAIESIPN